MDAYKWARWPIGFSSEVWRSTEAGIQSGVCFIVWESATRMIVEQAELMATIESREAYHFVGADTTLRENEALATSSLFCLSRAVMPVLSVTVVALTI